MLPVVVRRIDRLESPRERELGAAREGPERPDLADLPLHLGRALGGEHDVHGHDAIGRDRLVGGRCRRLGEAPVDDADVGVVAGSEGHRELPRRGCFDQRRLLGAGDRRRRTRGCREAAHRPRRGCPRARRGSRPTPRRSSPDPRGTEGCPALREETSRSVGGTASRRSRSAASPSTPSMIGAAVPSTASTSTRAATTIPPPARERRWCATRARVDVRRLIGPPRPRWPISRCDRRSARPRRR